MSVALSPDTVLTAIALTDVLPVSVIAIVALGVPIAVTAGLTACVFEHNRVCEVLGLFVLLLVCIVLTSKTGHPVLFGCEVDSMSRVIFYFVLVTVMLTEVVQRRRLGIIRTQVAAMSASHVAATRRSQLLYVEIPYVTSQPNQFLLAALLHQTVWEKVGDG